GLVGGRGGRDGDRVRHAVRRVLVVCFPARRSSDLAGRVGVRRVLGGHRRRAVPKRPAIAGDRAVGITARAREVAHELGAARRERGDRRLVGGRGCRDGSAGGGGGRRGRVAGHGERARDVSAGGGGV